MFDSLLPLCPRASLVLQGAGGEVVGYVDGDGSAEAKRRGKSEYEGVGLR